MDCLLDPDDIIRVIRHTLEKPALKSFLNSVDTQVSRLPVARDWQAWHNNFRMEMSGGLLVDATALHSFVFISRARPGLSAPLPSASGEPFVAGTNTGLYIY